MINLSNREKNLIIVLISVVILGIFYTFIISPVVEFKKNAEQSFVKNISLLNKFEEINNEYKLVLAEKSRLSSASGMGTGIAGLVDEISKSLNIASNRTSKKEMPGIVQNGLQKITTEIRFEGISIQSALEFINRLENSNMTLKVKNVVINAAIKERSRYDIIITVVSLTKR
ncbi:MAG TPA: type II secretion system protein GspM [Spirochaetota bacterium]|nr:type II secretion system protein GspM [Spirochaetota bacterium]